MKEKLFNQFLKILIESTAEIGSVFFNLPVASGDPIKRERTYGYELYRIIRNKIVSRKFPYEITGEVDKVGHPVIESQCGPINPDFIVHNPGIMGPDDNLVILEVKTSAGNLTDGIAKDIETLRCMTNIENGYYRGIILISGELSAMRLILLKARLKRLCSDDIDKIFFLHHYEIGKPAVLVTL